MPRINVVQLARDDVQVVIDKIKREGWTQGNSQYGDGPACLINHISKIGPKYLLLASEIQHEIGKPTIVEWNDTIGRTKENVIALLEKVRDKCLV